MTDADQAMGWLRAGVPLTLLLDLAGCLPTHDVLLAEQPGESSLVLALSLAQ